MIQYNEFAKWSDMPLPIHPHTHAPGERHPHAAVPTSLLRLSFFERLTIAALLAMILWGAVIWAIGSKV
jgi:hypothetical protein